ncbi:MAG: hypothetical protein ACREBC_03540 [Pyrinomonadaceae bacterium]
MTDIGPTQVPGAIGYATEISLYSPPLKVTTEDETTVSSEQLDIDETLTVYLFLPPAQLPIRPKTPTFMPGEADSVLNVGVVTTAQPPVDPPRPGLPFWANKGTDTKIKQTSAKALLIKRLGIFSPSVT